MAKVWSIFIVNNKIKYKNKLTTFYNNLIVL